MKKRATTGKQARVGLALSIFLVEKARQLTTA
jgi:hypothetical protein